MAIWGGLVTCTVLFARAPVLELCFYVFVNVCEAPLELSSLSHFYIYKKFKYSLNPPRGRRVALLQRDCVVA